ncbi:hypothetical protein CDD80_347 [Ophiocordyceps camponoti-rufipedis]|uniref:Uncharacterized protein n=1 Tax=Ophiocordyceps camponoti-rufipedis TaxID=2004952 RepID=A0A2C5ZI13_9HYPO|nr:hypothetical protein CDD80_347 [Ophiocordyceps camponoti-rufipedis]
MAFIKSSIFSTILVLSSLTSLVLAAPQGRAGEFLDAAAGRVLAWGTDSTVQDGITQALNGGPLDQSVAESQIGAHSSS